MILGIETVTRVGSLAVVEHGKILAQSTIDTELNHAANLVSVLDILLKSISTDISGIDTIAVDIGPGSFTGIKVGIASARGLAQPGGKNLIGICSLEILCYEVLKKKLLKEKMQYLVPFIDAKRGGIYTGCYQIKNNGLQIMKNPYLTTLKGLLSEMPPNSYIFGPDINMHEERQDPVFPSAGALAWIAERKRNKGFQEKSVEPMYIYDVEYRKI